MIEEQRGANEAEEILEGIGFDTLPIIPEHVANEINDDSFRLVLESKPFDSQKILGTAIGNNSGALIYINQNITDKGRYNFTTAHEIGHVCMHIMTGIKNSFECSNKIFSNQHSDPREKEANGFASGLLMPKNLIQTLTDGELHWDNINTISKKCGTSLEASYRRYNMIHKTPSALVIHKDGNFQRFVANDNFYFYIERSPLSYEQKSLSTDIKTEQYPSTFEEGDASDWVNPGCRGDTLQRIYSSTISLNDGFTYTLLTYDDECLDEEEL